MIVDIVDNQLIIDDAGLELSPIHISQISYWGFSRISSSNMYSLTSTNTKVILKKLILYFTQEKISYQLSPTCEKIVTEILDSKDKVNEIKSKCRNYKSGIYDSEDFEEFNSFIDNNIKRSLRDHQVKASYHLYLSGNGANFSVPGSGKTSVVLTIYEKLRLEGKVNLLYIIGPPACFGPWRHEFEQTLGRFPIYTTLAGGEPVQRRMEYYSSQAQNSELYLTTFQTLINDRDDLIKFLSRPGNDAFLVVDEAHYIKQIGGTWANAVLDISEYSKYRCVLTGTPIPRSYSDIFNLFDFLWPNENPIDADTKIRIKLHEDNNNDSEVKKILDENIGPLFYRVRKSELGLLQPNFHSPTILKMNKYERMIYDAIVNRIIDYSRSDYLKNIDFVDRLRRGRIIRLRQCVSHAKLLQSALPNYSEELISSESQLMKIVNEYDSLETPAKLEYLLSLVADLQKENQKVVIWSHFIGTLRRISDLLTKSGYYCKLIYGETPIEQTSIENEDTRENIRNEFVDPNSGLDILIANPAACGESISLHKTCFNAIYYDLSFNCAQYLQSLDRIHRVGGSETNVANYYFLQYDDSIDQIIKANLDLKSKKMYDIIEEPYEIYSLDMFENDDELQAYNEIVGKLDE